MGNGDLPLCCLFVISAVFGTVTSVHRNTVDVSRTRSTVVRQRIHALNPGPSRQTSGFLQQQRSATPPRHRDPTDTNVIDRSGTRHSSLPSRGHPTVHKSAHVDLPGEHGNRSPYPVVHRERGSSPRRSDASQNAVAIDTEPPVIFLNRERIRRRNRLLRENRRLNPAPTDVAPSSFERRRISSFSSVDGQFPDRQFESLSPAGNYDGPFPRDTGMTGISPPYTDNPMYPPGMFPPMTSFPGNIGGPSPHPESRPVNPMMQRPQNYAQIMISVEQMLDALPFPMRRLLRMRRRMRRLNRLRMMQDARFREEQAFG